MKKKRFNILIVEESQTQAIGLSAVLEAEGWHVVIASSGEGALQEITGTSFSLIIVNYHLRDMAGDEFCRRLRAAQQASPIPVIMLTSDVLKTSDDPQGPDAYLTKPVDEKTLLIRIQALLRHSRNRSSKQAQGPKAPKLLVVDDSRTYQDYLEAVLVEEGYDVVRASNGPEALIKFAREPFDGVLVDLVMPGIGGVEVCAQLIQAQPPGAIPVVILMLTAHEDKDEMTRGLAAGADDFVGKSSDLAILRARIRVLLRRRLLQIENRRILEELKDNEMQKIRALAQKEVAEARAGMVEKLERTAMDLQHANEALARQNAERQATAEKLLEAQQLARIGSWEWDMTNNSISWSDQMYHVSKVPFRTPIKIGTYMSLVHPEDVKRVRAAFKATVSTHEPFQLEHRIVRGDREVIHIFTRGQLVTDKSGKAIKMFGIAQDISERKHIERMKNEFISMVSHELRTPLTSIRASLGLIAGGVVGEIPPKAKDLITIATNNSQRLIRLINDILSIDKIESGNMPYNIQAVDVAASLKQAMADNQGFASQFGVTFVIKGEVPDEKVMADHDGLMQILTNLISNAAKFSQPGGTIDLSADIVDGYVRFGVADHGPGIPLEFRDRIFGKFAQADASDTRAKGGTGLGLSITRAIVERLEGRIWFESEIDKGTTFFFQLPRAGGGNGR